MEHVVDIEADNLSLAVQLRLDGGDTRPEPGSSEKKVQRPAQRGSSGRQSMSIPHRWTDRFAFVYAIMLSGAAYQPVTRLTGAGARSTDAGVYVALIVLLYLIGALIIVGKDLHVFSRKAIGRPLLPLFIFCGFVSYLLSSSAGTYQLVQFSMYAITGLFGLWASTRYSAETALAAFFKVAAIALVLHWLLFPVLNGQIVFRRANLTP